ncbi:MAG: hypothetical protein JO138_05495 [Acidobacteriaceae bacterium]|nr:hypothetical protein [Acidobacteriaceae bacterium]
MKLRFRHNSLRLRLNRKEVEALAAGVAIEENVLFPGESRFSYILEPAARVEPEASFRNGTIRVCAPPAELKDWAGSDAIGIYFDLPAEGGHLKIAIEKDLECVDRSIEEHDPDAFPRTGKNC